MTATLPPDAPSLTPSGESPRLFGMPRFSDPDRVFHYEYSCVDNSILSPHLKRFVCLPFSKLLPPTLHPNVLTLMAALCPILAFALTADAFGEFNDMGIWGPLAAAALVFAYTTLDNSDGLQARKTKTSSPLGDFLDHFFDAGGAVLVPMAIMVGAGMSPTLQIVAVTVIGFMFWIVNWEKGHTGTMVIPPVGDVEGNAAAIAWWLVAATFGGAVWTETYFGVKVIDFMHWFTIPVFVGVGFAAVVPLFKVKEGRSESLGVLLNILLLAGWALLALDRGVTVVTDVPLVVLLIGYTCAKHIADIQRGHLIGVVYRPYDPLLLLLAAGLVVSLFVHPALLTNDVQLYLGLSYGAVLLAKLGYQVRHTAKFICDKLGIKVFSLTDAQKAALDPA